MGQKDYRTMNCLLNLGENGKIVSQKEWSQRLNTFEKILDERENNKGGGRHYFQDSPPLFKRKTETIK